MGFVGIGLIANVKLHFLKFKLNKRGLSFFRECIHTVRTNKFQGSQHHAGKVRDKFIFLESQGICSIFKDLGKIRELFFVSAPESLLNGQGKSFCSDSSQTLCNFVKNMRIANQIFLRFFSPRCARHVSFSICRTSLSVISLHRMNKLQGLSRLLS